MVKVIIHIIICVFLFGCHAIPVLPSDEYPEEKTVSVSVCQPVTRSFNGTVAETWEKKINTAAIYIFNPAGKTVRAYTLTAAQITAINNGTNMVINMIVPGNLTSCDVYFVANTTPSANIATKTSFLTSYEQDIANYNGVYTDVTTKALRTNGFVLTGKMDGVVLNTSQTTPVAITLRRIVAKVAVDISFTTVLNLGTLTLNNVTLTNSSPYSNLFPLDNAKTGGTPLTLSQAPVANGTNKYRAFFYIYENDALASNVAPTLNISGSGLILIISTPFSYRIPLSGDLNGTTPTGKITRNRVYYINISVTKLTNILLLSRSQSDIIVEQYTDTTFIDNF